MRSSASRIRVTGLMVAGAILGSLLVGCGAADGIEVDGAWARASPAMATRGAVYMELTASEDNRLIAASVADEVAGTVEIHETAMMDGGGDETTMSDDSMEADAEESMDDDAEPMDDESMDDESMEADAEHMDDESMEGAMTMRELTDGLRLPAGDTVSLAPGGYHLMLLDLPDPLETGETFDVTLEFEDGQSVVIAVPVRQDAP